MHAEVMMLRSLPNTERLDSCMTDVKMICKASERGGEGGRARIAPGWRGEGRFCNSSTVDERPIVLFTGQPVKSDVCLARLRANSIVTILRKEDNGWWLGLYDDEVGWFPEKFCVEVNAQDAGTG